MTSAVRDSVVRMIYEITAPEAPDLENQSLKLVGDVLDSLDFATLLMMIEDEYGLTFGEGVAEELASLDQIVAFIVDKASLESP